MHTTNYHKVGVDCCFLIIGDCCWGKGDTMKEAKERAKENGSSDCVKSYFLYLVPPSARVTGMGDIEWEKEEGKPDILILLQRVKNGKEIPLE